MDQAARTVLDWVAAYGPIFQALSWAVGIVGLPYLIFQVFNLRNNVRGATLDRVYGQYKDLCGIFVADPSLRKYFYDQQSVPVDSGDRQKALAVSEAIFGLIEHSIVQRPNMPSWCWEHCWRPYALERIRQGPIMQEYFAANREWYTGQMRQQYASIEADLRRPPSKLELFRRRLPWA
jgi:hypothetical protein